MIPNNISNNQEHDIVKNFILGISWNYKRICYLYRFVSIGKGRYVDIIAFERIVYSKPYEIDKTYKKDMYVNKLTGQTTKATDPNAIHRCK